MAGFIHNANHGQLSIAAASTINLMDPRWRCMNLVEVNNQTLRGTDLVLPTVTGRRSRRRYVDELVVPLMMVVRGDVDSSAASVAGSSRFTQLTTNTLALKAIATPPASNTGYTATYTAAGQSAKTASVWVEDFQVAPDLGGVINRVTFQLVIPAGGWA
jgi:hypothetical protein